jgi:predicted acyl esterase
MKHHEEDDVQNEGHVLRETRDYSGEKIDVIWRKAKPIEESGGTFPPLQPGVTVEDGIVNERDVAVVLRDGTTIYTDIYRPEGAVNVPAIVAWSPYGKRSGYTGGNLVPGVVSGTYSEMAKEEGPDPAYWCRHGYAVINPDARGAGNSEGNIWFWTSNEGKDCADLIDWVGQRDWCNGKVGMSGSSWLGVSQFFAAAERPEHLACIAPWEGMTDFYRHVSCHGGIQEIGFSAMVVKAMHGPGYVDDFVAMNREYPFINGYWEDKMPALERIDVPTYLAAGFSHFHLYGSFDAFRRISSPKKWLRAHRDFEWPDYYRPENIEDLRRFFDRFLKGIRNGWEMTPRLRLDVMDAGDRDYVSGRPETDFPLPCTQYEQLYLDASTHQLSTAPVGRAASTRYDAERGRATFDFAFAEATELTGYMKLRLWVEAADADDMDLFVVVQKLDAAGNERPTLVMGQPHPGAWGMLRASHRELDEQRSTPSQPVHPHRREERLSVGEIVPVEIGIWPSSKFWHAGEQLRLVVSGHYVRDPGWFEPFKWDLRNRGAHIIHAGGEFDSHLLVPKIPNPRPVMIDRQMPTMGADDTASWREQRPA